MNKSCNNPLHDNYHLLQAALKNIDIIMSMDYSDKAKIERIQGQLDFSKIDPKKVRV